MSKKRQGEVYRLAVLKLLSEVGYASTRQVARGVWKRCDISTRKMAGRTLRWLLKRNLIVSKRDGKGVLKVNNELLFALTTEGAKLARHYGSPLAAEKIHARDYLRHSHSHRTACNSAFVAWPTSPIWSELKVRASDCPINEFTYTLDGVESTKIPDLIAEAQVGGYEWIEVENSWRSEKDLMKLVECMRVMFYQNNNIACVHFVVTVAGARTIGRRVKEKLTHSPTSGWPAYVKALDARIINNHIDVSILDPETLTLEEFDWNTE